MRRSFFSLLALEWLLFLFVSGCASSPTSRFYQLSSLKMSSLNSGAAGAGEKLSGIKTKIFNIKVGPVQIPDYLDRPQIVTASGGNELKLAEFDRWAGSLEQDVTRVMSEDLAVLLPADRFRVAQWSSWSAAASQYQVAVNIIRFEGAPGRSVLLKAQWTIFNREHKLKVHEESVITEEVHGATYGAFVMAMSNALAGLSRAIAGSIMSL